MIGNNRFCLRKGSRLGLSFSPELGFIACSPSLYEMPHVSTPDSTFHKSDSNPERAVERAILNRFAYVLRQDVDLVVQIGDGAGNL